MENTTPTTPTKELLSHINVLVIEDNRDDALSLKMMLEGRPEVDYRVETVTTLKGALALPNRDNVEVIMLDLHVPDAAGPDLVARVKEGYPDVGVIVVTGWAEDNMEQKVREAGAEEFLTKPVDPAVVSRKLQSSVIYHRNNKMKELIGGTLAQLGQVLDSLSESGKFHALRGFQSQEKKSQDPGNP